MPAPAHSRPTNSAWIAPSHPPGAAPALALAPVLQDLLDEVSCERFVAAGFDRTMRLRTIAHVNGGADAIGSVLPAVRSSLGAADVINLLIAHSHPGQCCIASVQDMHTTRRIAALARLAGITLLDHLIFGADGIFSCLGGQRLTGGVISSPFASCQPKEAAL